MIKHNNFKSTEQKSRSQSAFLINTNAKSINVAPFEISNVREDPEHYHQNQTKNSGHSFSAAMNVLKNINNLKRCKQETENTFQAMVNKIIVTEKTITRQHQIIQSQKYKMQQQEQTIHQLKLQIRKQQEQKEKLQRIIQKLGIQDKQKEKQITQLYKQKAESERKHRTNTIVLQTQLLQLKLTSQEYKRQKQFEKQIQRLNEISIHKDQSTALFQN